MGIFLLSLNAALARPVQSEKLYFPGGKLKVKYYYYLEGEKKVLHGKYEEYFTSGSRLNTWNFRNGRLNGKSQEFYHNQIRKWRGRFKDDYKVGKWIYWDSLGRKKLEAQFTSGGELKKMVRYNIDGRPRLEEIYAKGQLVDQIYLDKKGKKGYRGPFSKSEVEVKAKKVLIQIPRPGLSQTN